MNRSKWLIIGLGIVALLALLACFYSAGIDNEPTNETGAAEKPITAQEQAALFDTVLHDTDFRARMRAMDQLPRVPDREKAIDILIGVLRDHESGNSGGGNVPANAAGMLAEMNATRALPDLADWVDYLEKNRPHEDQMRSSMLSESKGFLERLKSTTKPASPAPATAPVAGV